MEQRRSRTEEFNLKGDEVVAKVKELINEGNIRRLSIRNEEGRTLLEIPLTIGVVGGVLGVAVAPVLAAVGALAALVTRLSIVVERAEPEAGAGGEPASDASEGDAFQNDALQPGRSEPESRRPDDQAV